MSCTSCSISKKGATDGVKGSCSSGGCNKLNVYNWLSNISLPPGQEEFPIVEVRFKGSRKEFFRNTDGIQLLSGDVVAVEGSPGHDIGVVSMAGELVRLQLKKKNVTEDSAEIKGLYRKARQADVDKWQEVQKLEKNTMYRARSIASQLKLTMKLSDVEYQGDGKKATFYYTADERVDFRELIKRLADEFKVRIEMRQIGMRQEASRLGGIGSCGRELCCSSWLTDFRSVSTGAARYQNLSLNPLKLAGQCGKLKCCLNYELDSYIDALKEFPDNNIALKTQKGKAFHKKTDIFKRMMWYSYEGGRPGDEHFDPMAESGNWVAMKVDRVNEIIALNEKNVLPEDLSRNEFMPTAQKKLDYENVVGQDSITRMDKKKKSGGGGGQHRDRDRRKEGGSSAQASTAGKPQGAQQQGPRPDQPKREGQNQRRNNNQRQPNNNPNQAQGQPQQPRQGQPRQPRNPNQEARQQPIQPQSQPLPPHNSDQGPSAGSEQGQANNQQRRNRRRPPGNKTE